MCNGQRAEEGEGEEVSGDDAEGTGSVGGLEECSEVVNTTGGVGGLDKDAEDVAALNGAHEGPPVLRLDKNVGLVGSGTLIHSAPSRA